MAEVVEDPPQARGVNPSAFVVDDNAGCIRDAEPPHRVLELRHGGQKRRRVVPVADRVRLQIYGAWHVAVAVAGASHIDDADVGVGRVRSNPIGFDQLLGMCVSGHQQRQQQKHPVIIVVRPGLPVHSMN